MYQKDSCLGRLRRQSITEKMADRKKGCGKQCLKQVIMWFMDITEFVR